MTDRLPIIWTAAAIGAYLGVGVDAVDVLSREPGSPIRRRAGRIYAFADDLEAWMRSAASGSARKGPSSPGKDRRTS